MFGFYLSSFIIMSISVDRYYAIVHPLLVIGSRLRSVYMVLAAWTFSLIFSLPQAVIFHIESHPLFTWYKQCVNFNSFFGSDWELAYNYFGFTFIYALPLATTLICYCHIFGKIWRANAERNGQGKRFRKTWDLLFH